MRKIITFLFSCAIVVSCKEELPTAQEFPILRTLSPSNVNEKGATFRAELLQKGGAEMTSYGFIWNVSHDTNPEAYHKIILGTNADNGLFEKQINHSIAKGLAYNVRAFATFSDKTVYGNIVVLNSKGSEYSPWSLLIEEIFLNGSFSCYGSANNSNGIVVFQSSEMYYYNPPSNSFSPSSGFATAGGNSGTQFGSIQAGDVLYFISSIDRNLYRLENKIWAFQSLSPARFFSGNLYHGHFFSNKLFILNPINSYIYDLALNTWTKIANVPESKVAVGGVSLREKAYIMTSDKKLWEFDPINNTWEIKTLYPGNVGARVVSFAYENKVYFGSSSGNRGFWSYDVTQDHWNQEESFPVLSTQSFFFSLNNKLYIGTNQKPKAYALWEFDPSKLK